MFIDAAKTNVPNYKVFHPKKNQLIKIKKTKTKTEKKKP